MLSYAVYAERLRAVRGARYRTRVPSGRCHAVGVDRRLTLCGLRTSDFEWVHEDWHAFIVSWHGELACGDCRLAGR